MWLYMLGGALLILGILGGVALGGIFTLVLVPLGVIVTVSAIVAALWGRASQIQEGAGDGTGGDPGHPLPHSSPSAPARVPTSPERLADARRAEQ